MRDLRNAMLVPAWLLLGACSTAGPRDAAVDDLADIAQAVEAAEPINPALPAAAQTEPSVLGHDRSNWPTIVVHPASGRVRHAPAYLGGRGQTALQNVDPAALTDEERIRLAFGPLYEGSALAAAFWEPVQFAGQIATLPLSVVTQPPGSRASSGVQAPAASAPGTGLGRGSGPTRDASESGGNGLGGGAGTEAGAGAAGGL